MQEGQAFKLSNIAHEMYLEISNPSPHVHLVCMHRSLLSGLRFVVVSKHQVGQSLFYQA